MADFGLPVAVADPLVCQLPGEQGRPPLFASVTLRGGKPAKPMEDRTPAHLITLSDALGRSQDASTLS
jgi:hypothetical protein